MPYRWDEEPPPISDEDPDIHWARRLKQARGAAPDGIRLGKNLQTQLPVFITPDQLRTHMHVVGATNVGKSYFLEGIMKQLILGGHGLCLIDPHGDLYHRMLDFCAYMGIEEPGLHLERRVIPFDIAETKHLLAFNPVQRNARVMTYQVVALMEAIRKCWSGDSFVETPRLARWLFNTGYAVVDGQATFLQAYDMVDPKPNTYRDALTRRVKNPQIRGEWEWIAKMKGEKREERLESTFNRIREFVGHEILRLIVGQHTNTLDFGDVLGGRKILLVNLAQQNTISEDNQHLLGTLLVNELVTAAFAQQAGKRPPFFLFLDEFQHFVTKDMCEILDGGRKFGLHLILAHQHLNQLKEKDPEVYYSVLTNARLKAVFGGLIDDDLDVLARELYTGEFNPNEIKDEVWQTKYKPVETTRVVRSDSYSHTDSNSHTDMDSSGLITHESLITAETYIPGSGQWSRGSAESSGSGSADGYSSADTSASSRALVPWYEYHEYKELSSRQFRSLEEQLYIKKAQMKRQPGQHLAILIPDTDVQLAKSPTLKDLPVKDRHRSEFVQACMEGAHCFKSPDEAEREIEGLKHDILFETRAPAYQILTAEVKSADTPPGVPRTEQESPLPKSESAPAAPEKDDPFGWT